VLIARPIVTGYDLEKNRTRGEFMLWRGDERATTLKTGEASGGGLAIGGDSRRGPPVDSHVPWGRSRAILDQTGEDPASSVSTRPGAVANPADDKLKHFVAGSGLTPKMSGPESSDKPGREYRDPKLVLSRIRCSLLRGTAGERERGLFIVRAIRRCTLTSRFIAI